MNKVRLSNTRTHWTTFCSYVFRLQFLEIVQNVQLKRFIILLGLSSNNSQNYSTNKQIVVNCFLIAAETLIVLASTSSENIKNNPTCTKLNENNNKLQGISVSFCL